MIKINDKFKPLWEEDYRYYLITGGRNSSKSFSVNTYLTQKTFQSNQKILHTRFTMSSAHLSIIPEFEEKIDILNAREYFNINRAEILNNASGSQVLFRGIKTSSGMQTANLKSLQGVNIWVLDEAEEEDSEDRFDKIDLSVRNPKEKNIVIIILNPTTKEHWIWKRWFDGYLKYIDLDGHKIPISTHPEVCHIHTTYLDNIDNIPDDYLRRIEYIKQSNPEKYRHVILGGWLEKAEGVIFENWEEGNFNESIPYGFGLDFGYAVDPDALVRVAIDNKRKVIYLKEELYKNKISTDKLKDIILNITGRREVIADCAEPRLIDDLSDAKINITRSVKGANSVGSGIKLMQGYRIIVDPSSVNLKRELNNYAWSDKKGEVPVDDFNHLIDAARYYIFKKLGKQFDAFW